MDSDGLKLPEGCFVADSVTHLGPEARGSILISGSHGGVYAAYCAARAGVAGVILNDAAVGRDEAGIAGLAYLDRYHIPAATVGHDTARIGDGRDCALRGILTHANKEAAARGVTRELPALVAAAKLAGAGSVPPKEVPAQREARLTLDIPGARRSVHVMDSNSLVEPSDKGSVIVTGSHGGLLGGRPETAVKVEVFAALYNDAGIGIDGAGIARLPALDARGIAAGTVDAWSARIGDGRSSLDSGLMSRVNLAAKRLGARPGMPGWEFVALMAGVDSDS